MTSVYILPLKQARSRDGIRFRNTRGKLRRVPGVFRWAFDVRFGLEVILKPTVEGPGVSRGTADMPVAMTSQVAVGLGLQFLGVGALKGLVIVYGFAQNTVEYLALVIPHRVQYRNSLQPRSVR